MLKKTAALLLALVICLGALTGCASNGGIAEALGQAAPQTHSGHSPEPSPENTVSAAGTYFDSSVWRADEDYADMSYSHYDLTQLNEYAQVLVSLGENGGTEEQFKEANYDFLDEVYYIYTLTSLIELEYTRDPTDEYVSDEYNYTIQLWYDAYDIYWETMGSLAGSAHSDLLGSYYADWQIEWFGEPYDPDSGDELSNREDALVQEYYTIMADDDPDYDAAVTVFVQLVAVRNELAAEYGYDSYAEYAYGSTYARNYSPEDAGQIWACVKEYYAPLVAKYGNRAYRAANRLWNASDLDCSPESVSAAIGSGAANLSDEVLAAYDYMISHDLCDMEQSDTKINTDYTTVLYYYNEPYIINAASGGFSDYLDMFHEFGHFVNFFYSASDLMFGLADNDLCELQSQGMEMMFTQYYSDIFGSHADDALSYELMSMVYSIIDGSMYDEFLQRVYSEPELTEAKVLEIYTGLYGEYGYSSYAGYEYEWVGVPHNFDYPFYYISYGVSAVSALEIYSSLLDSPEKAVDTYLTVAAMDPEAYYFSDALEEAGLSDVFSPEVYERTSEAVIRALG